MPGYKSCNSYPCSSKGSFLKFWFLLRHCLYFHSWNDMTSHRFFFWYLSCLLFSEIHGSVVWYVLNFENFSAIIILNISVFFSLCVLLLVVPLHISSFETGPQFLEILFHFFPLCFSIWVLSIDAFSQCWDWAQSLAGAKHVFYHWATDSQFSLL